MHLEESEVTAEKHEIINVEQVCVYCIYTGPRARSCSAVPRTRRPSSYISWTQPHPSLMPSTTTTTITTGASKNDQTQKNREKRNEANRLSHMSSCLYQCPDACGQKSRLKHKNFEQEV